ncbi:MAG TPA: glycosyltransferase family 39 protein [Gaiellaceae bacterium]|nr:glycosyltransferase family 39 protein [Gaiellaceae bacterium]
MTRAPAFARWALAPAAAQLVALLATSTRYGYHRDELYFIVAGSHPALGYPDQPPLVPLVCRAMHDLWPSLVVLRLPSALVAAATTVVAALVAREAGGARRAQTIAAACTAASGFALAVGHFVTTTTFDLLSTSLFLWLVIRAVVRRSGPAMLAAGVVVGVGCEAKPQVGFVAAVVVAALLVVGPREVLRSRWTLGGVVAAVAIAAPYVVWQQRHGWPQVTVAGNIGGSAEGGRIGFVPFQLLLVSPVLVPVWVAGLALPYRRPGLRALRFVTVTYGVLAVAYIVGNGKAYYLASLYPVLLGLGALRAAEWRRRRSLLVAIALSAVVSAFIALPLLPARSLQGNFVMAINPDQGETVGWPRFVATVGRAWRSLPAAERARTAIFTANYGEAGAVDVLGRGLPRAYSGHNGFSEWGTPPPRDAHAIVLGYDGPRDAAPAFSGCRTLARIDDRVGLSNDEQGLPVLFCRPAASWARLWPKLTHYD